MNDYIHYIDLKEKQFTIKTAILLIHKSFTGQQYKKTKSLSTNAFSEKKVDYGPKQPFFTDFLTNF